MMITNPTRLLRGALRRAGSVFFALSDRIPCEPVGAQVHHSVDVLEHQKNWVICRTGVCIWRLDPSQCIDNAILSSGVFEPDSIKWLQEIIKPGMTVLDVGANFGYYAVQLSKLVEPEGQVHAFEPSARYRARLFDHLQRNECANVVVSDYGLSDQSCKEQLYGDDISATMHWPDDAKRHTTVETIKLKTLDSYVNETQLSRLDFIKVDIDGHEPRFLAGAVNTIQRFRPIILIEFSQLSLIAAGSGGELLAEQLSSLGYSLCSERTGMPYLSYAEFLRDAVNCSHSVNVICYPDAYGVVLKLRSHKPFELNSLELVAKLKELKSKKA